MKTITLHVISADDVAASEVPPLVLDGVPLERWFYNASNQFLTLNIVNHRSMLRSVDADGPLLHRMLREHVPWPVRRPVDDIGLLFCRNWRSPAGHTNLKLYGLMFDVLRADPPDPLVGPLYSYGVPREGCAIFLDPLEGRADHIVFTAIHELGHVFNLPHDWSQQSFMAGDPTLPGAFSQRNFLISDRTNLAKAACGLYPSYEMAYLPGGDDFRDVAPTLASPGSATLPSTATGKDGLEQLQKRSVFELTIRLAKPEYLLGEPITLDMLLRPTGEARLRVPPVLDPGYPHLRVWYETPAGERLLHRPPVRYCQPLGKGVLLSRSRPMRNNPRVSLGASGITFDVPGPYRLWADLTVNGERVRSNVVHFELVFARDRDEAEISHVLRNPTVAYFVAYKGGILATQERDRLATIARRWPSHDAIQHVRYALAVDSVRSGKLNGAKQWLEGVRFREESLRRGISKLRGQLRGHLSARAKGSS